MSPGGGELSLSVCPGVGNRTSSTQMPGGVPGGEMVTGRIEPRITTSFPPLDTCIPQPWTSEYILYLGQGLGSI